MTAKKITLILFLGLMAAMVSGCGRVEPETPGTEDPTPVDPAPEDPTPQEPEEDESVIAGTRILEGNDLVGRITSSADGNGIEGVTVPGGSATHTYTCSTLTRQPDFPAAF